MILGTGNTSITAFCIATALLLVLIFLRRTKTIPKGLRLPPGPHGKPIVGNVWDMPTHHEWETYTRWAEEYGDLVHVRVFGRDMIFVNTAKVAHDLFNSRSSIYSDRCDFPMLKLMGAEWNFGVMEYGERWRRHRKLFHQHFHAGALEKYKDLKVRHARVLLRRLCQSPADFTRHVRYFGGSIIIEIVYGIKVLPTNDPYIEIAEKAMAAVGKAANPGSFLVDTLPILRFVPEWMPGAGFQKLARIWRGYLTETPAMPFATIKKEISAGTAGPSVTASLLEEMSHETDVPADAEEVICGVAGAAYIAGADTMISALNIFILAILLHPEAQRKAQAEIDTVIGMNRLPTFEDKDDLPYTTALCQEALRWHPVGPLGIAHRLTEDDVYGDLFLPKGSTIIGNAWAMLHEETAFGANTEEFIPERFLEPEARDTATAFGFGRRICPGRALVDNVLFIMAASILQVFDIVLAKDDNGNEIPVKAEFTSGFISRAVPFKCEIRTRSALAESLLTSRTDDG